MSNAVRLSTVGRARRNSSAVSKVQMSGLELVPTRKVRGRKATTRDLARLSWKPWEKTDKPGPSAGTMDTLGFYCRLSAAIMTKTKAELIESHTRLDHKAMDEMVAGLIDAAEMLKAFASVSEAAYLRVMASASAHYLSGGKFRGVHDMRKKRRAPRRA